MRKSRVSNSSLIPDASSNAQTDGQTEAIPPLESVLKVFWDDQKEELQKFKGFQYHDHLPLTRVRKILKSNPQVGMITWDTPALFSIACEYFILELTLRAWNRTQQCTRDTIHRCDIYQAMKKSEIYGFLIDHVVHQGASPPLPELVLPDMNVPPLDMNQIPQENPISEQSISNNRGFDLNVDLQDCTSCRFGFCSEHDCEGSCPTRET